ncbi:alpha/beta hydrolase [Paenibacillus senegalensis]|uniref:alpha/beta hydrolase n=1 Tax=Paenibacillus senegalensis TaxID=1465766 RepID=UPI000288FBFE|nr:alpha/beta hydrolase [Paenibacillus senegalensis]
MEVICDCKEIKDARGAIVLVHGAGEHFARYEWLCEQLNKEGFSVYGGDLPGYGRTAGKRGHINSFAQYFQAVERWLQQASYKDRPVYLLGHSMGGLVTIRYAMENSPQVNGIILSSPCLKLYRQVSRSLEMLVSVLNRSLPGLQFKSGIQPGAVSRSKEVQRRVTDDPYYAKKVSVRWYKELSSAMAIAREQTSRFPDIPLLVMQAGDDLVVQAEASREWYAKLEIPDKHYREWPGLYHELFNEPEKQEVFAYMLDWLEAGR